MSSYLIPALKVTVIQTKLKSSEGIKDSSTSEGTNNPSLLANTSTVSTREIRLTLVVF